jgi:hypothetical protein
MPGWHAGRLGVEPMIRCHVIDPIESRCRLPADHFGKPSPTNAIDGLGDVVSITAVVPDLYDVKT